MGQLPNLNEFMRISRRILAGLATASLAVTVTSCGGGSDTSGSFDDTVTVGIFNSKKQKRAKNHYGIKLKQLENLNHRKM